MSFFGARLADSADVVGVRMGERIGAQEEDMHGVSPSIGRLPTLLESMRAAPIRDPFSVRKPKIEIATGDAEEQEVQTQAVEERGGTATSAVPVQESDEHQASSATDLRVRNTFIDIRSPSHDIWNRRAVSSCPGQHVGILRSAFDSAHDCSDLISSQNQVDRLAACDDVGQTGAAPSKPVLLLVDALGGECNLVPNTPEAFSMSHCYGSSMFGDAPFSCLDAPVDFSEPLTTNTGRSTAETYSAQPHVDRSNALLSLCPDWFQNGQVQTQACGVMNEASLEPMVNHGASTVPWFEQASTQGNNMIPTACLQAQCLSSGLHASLQQSLAANLLPAPPAPPSFYAPECVSRFVAFDPPAPSEPAPGSEEMPSIGSIEHASGSCKPCAFLYTKGCENGALCKFCHICGPGEKKRRQKEKKLANRGGA